MKLLITGSSGFIGNHIFGEMDCCAKGLIPYDLKTGDDIRDRRKLDHLFETEQFDVVVHCAALTGVRRGEEYPQEYLETNVMGTKNIVDMCDKYGVAHLINFSSSSVYGQEKPDAISEDSVKNPKTIYGMTKLMAEHIVERAKTPTTTIRPFTVYGDIGRADQVVQKWINLVKKDKPITIYGSGDTARGYTYVKDLVRGVKDIIRRPPVFDHEVFNLCGNELIYLRELVSIFKDTCPNIKFKDLPIPAGDNEYNFGSAARAKVMLNWEHKTDFKKTIKKIIEKQL